MLIAKLKAGALVTLALLFLAIILVSQLLSLFR